MSDPVAGAIVRKMYATEPDLAELEAGRALVLDLLDVYIGQAEQHAREHEATPGHAARAQEVLAAAVAARRQVAEGAML